MRLISAVVAVVFAVPVGGAALCADTPQKWLDRFTSANSTDTSADPTPEEAAAGFESGPFGIVFNEVKTYTPSVRGEEPQEKVKDTAGEEPVGEVSALEEATVREVNSEYTPVVGKALFSTSEDQSQESASPGIRAAADETPAAKAASDAIQWPEEGFTGETTITYDANGYTFPDGATTNVVTTKYDGVKEITKYAHTDNVNDAGVQNGGYGDNKSYSRVVTIPGASSLAVNLTYQTERTSYDWVCAYTGGTESSPAGDAQCSTAGSLTGKLGGTTQTTRSFTVDGDSVTFWFRSDGSNSNYYGYYAVVKGLVGSKESVSGTYAAPVDPSGEYKFSSWNTEPDGTGENLGAGEVYSPSNQTVYAQWELNYTKWNTVGWRITDDGVLKIRPWEGDTGTTGSVTYYANTPWYNQRSKIKKVESTGNIVLNANSVGLFYNCSNLTDITPLASWKVSNVTDMSYMFQNCSKLTDLNPLAHWNVSNVTNMSAMFTNCSSLTNLTGLANWNVSKVTDMSYMFSDCSSLTDLTALANWNVSNVTYMSYMFYRCSSLIDLTALSGWNVSNVTNMSSMFYGCSSLTDLTALAGWNVSKVTDMNSMFYRCSSLTDLTALSGWNVSNVTNMNSMFSSCSSLTTLAPLANWNVSNVTYMGSMFSNCSSLTDLTALEHWDVSNVTYMSSMFFSCSSLTDLTALAGWNVSNVTNMNSMFYGCSKLTTLAPLANWNVSKVTNMGLMFRGCSSLQKVGIPSIANGGQNLVSRVHQSYLVDYMPIIITDDFTMGPYSWSDLQSEMQTNPDAFQEGTVWVKYTPSWLVSYNANGGVGSMSGVMTPVNQTLTLPEASYLRFCYKFTGWTTQPDPVSDTNPLMKPGQIFDPYDKTDGKRYTLYAQWEKLDNTGDLPSSSQSGMLPGWVQVESGNTTGLIPPSSSITAWFKNKYAPGSTSLSLQFTKLLEGNAPDRVFQFDLYDVAANKVVQSVQNVGSAVKFNPLVFTKEGVYTYYVRESNTTDDKLIYDNSLRQVTVTVTADKDDPSKLTATAQILGDVTFNNKYKTASLKIRKTVEGTEAKDKDFSFVVDVTKSDGSKLEGAYPTQTGDSHGSVTFKEGIATLLLRADEEVAITGLPANSKYTVDETSLPKGYSIKNLSNPDGMLTPADTIEVTAENRYTTTPGIAQLKVLKRYVNSAGQDLPQKNGMFEFAVCEVVSETECNGIGEAQSNNRGEVVFPVISYADAGNHTYRISEIIGSSTSIAYDRALVTAEVTVTDNGKGELVTTIVYKDKDGNQLPEGELPVFVNRDASASIIPVTGSLAVWSFVSVFGAVALWLGVRAIRAIHGGRRGAAHAKR